MAATQSCERGRVVGARILCGGLRALEKAWTERSQAYCDAVQEITARNRPMHAEGTVVFFHRTTLSRLRVPEWRSGAELRGFIEIALGFRIVAGCLALPRQGEGGCVEQLSGPGILRVDLVGATERVIRRQ